MRGRGPAGPRSFALSCLLPSVRLVRPFPSPERGWPGLFTSRRLSLGPPFVPTSTPTRRGSSGRRVAGGWVGGGGGGRLAASPTEPHCLAEKRRAAWDSGLQKRSWRGQRSLMGTERCLWTPNVALRSDRGGKFGFSLRHFCGTLNPLSLPAEPPAQPLRLPNCTRPKPRMLPCGS